MLLPARGPDGAFYYDAGQVALIETLGDNACSVTLRSGRMFIVYDPKLEGLLEQVNSALNAPNQ